MTYALQLAANDLRSDIDRYGIVVDPLQNMIGWKDHVQRVTDSMSREVCKRYIRSYIKQAKELEQKRLNSRQVSLL